MSGSQASKRGRGKKKKRNNRKADGRRTAWQSVGKSSRPMSFKEAHRGCIDKTRFTSKKKVIEVARALSLRYYRCDFCGGFHLTKSKGAVDPWER